MQINPALGILPGAPSTSDGPPPARGPDTTFAKYLKATESGATPESQKRSEAKNLPEKRDEKDSGKYTKIEKNAAGDDGAGDRQLTVKQSSVPEQTGRSPRKETGVPEFEEMSAEVTAAAELVTMQLPGEQIKHSDSATPLLYGENALPRLEKNGPKTPAREAGEDTTQERASTRSLLKTGSDAVSQASAGMSAQKTDDARTDRAQPDGPEVAETQSEVQELRTPLDMSETSIQTQATTGAAAQKVQSAVKPEGGKPASVTSVEEKGSKRNIRTPREKAQLVNSAATESAASAGEGGKRRFPEIEVNLTETEELDLEIAQKELDGKNSETRDPDTFLTRLEHAPGTPPNRPATVSAAAGTLSRRLNGDLGHTIVRQAKVMLQESERAEIRLVIRPPELGRVRINLQMENGHIAGRIIVDNGSVREVIEQNLAALQRAFQEAGLDVGDFEVSTGDPRQEGTSGQEDRSHEPSRGSRAGAGRFTESVQSIELHDYGHRRINLVA